ncbi:MAG: type II toxin-antitoxin system HicA family toxin [Glycocaulis sp.]
MAEGFYRDVIKALKAAGFALVPGGKGSHEKWRKSGGPLVLVPRNLKSRHTANAIMKSAGLTVRF